MSRKFIKFLSALGALAISMSSVLSGSVFARERRQEVNMRLAESAGRDAEAAFDKLARVRPLRPDELVLVVDPELQRLHVMRNREIVKTYTISTSKYGLGTKYNSKQTPWGTHRIKTKIGHGVKPWTIFRYGENTGKIAKPWSSGAGVTSRIMWLQGLEEGVNFDSSITEENFRKKSGHVDTYWRHVYIHGTPLESRVGRPASIGCITMKNAEVIELFDMVPEGTLVEILHKTYVARN